MPTAHEQYYTQPDAGPLPIRYERFDTLTTRASHGDFDFTHNDKVMLDFMNKDDFYFCRHCGEHKGWHWHAGPSDGSDMLYWRGDFFIIDEEGLDILCEPCYDELTAEPDYDDEPPYFSYRTTALMKVIDSFFGKS